MKRIIFFCFLSLFLHSCYKSQASDVWSPPKAAGDDAEYVLINGEELDKTQWPWVVRIQTGSAGCTATVVGPRVVITAAHCGTTGATSTFQVAGKSYSGKVTRSDLYPTQDHDLAVIVLEADVPKAEVKHYATVGGAPEVGKKVYLAGFGCIRPNGGGGNDGILRGGFATVTGHSGYDVVSGKPGEAALCFGDSGGPMFMEKSLEKPVLSGVNSKGNIRDTNYNLNLTSVESKAFLARIAKEKAVEICGINGTKANCEEGGNPPPPPPPPPGDCDMTRRKELLLGVAACFQVPIVVPAGPIGI